MKVKAKALRVLVLSLLISFILFVLSVFLTGISSAASIILSSMFAGFVVSFITCCVEYLQEKTNAIEKFYCESERIKREMKKNAKYINPEKFESLDSKTIKPFIDGYINIFEIDLTNFGLMYTDIYFVTDLSSKHKKHPFIYYDIFQYIFNLQQSIHDVKSNLEEIRDSGYKRIPPTEYDSLNKMQENFFSIAENDNWVGVESTYLRKIEESNNKLLEMLTHEKQPLRDSYVFECYMK